MINNSAIILPLKESFSDSTGKLSTNIIQFNQPIFLPSLTRLSYSSTEPGYLNAQIKIKTKQTTAINRALVDRVKYIEIEDMIITKHMASLPFFGKTLFFSQLFKYFPKTL